MKMKTARMVVCGLVAGSIFASAAQAETVYFTDREAFLEAVAAAEVVSVQESFEDFIPGSDAADDARRGPRSFVFPSGTEVSTSGRYGLYSEDGSDTGLLPTEGGLGIGHQWDGRSPLEIALPHAVHAVGLDVVGFGSTNIDPQGLDPQGEHGLFVKVAGRPSTLVARADVSGIDYDRAGIHFVGVLDVESSFETLSLLDNGFYGPAGDVDPATAMRVGDGRSFGGHFAIDALTFGVTLDCLPDDDIRLNAHDDGIRERVIGLTGGGDMVWLTHFRVKAGVDAAVTKVQASWGLILEGRPTYMCVWSDPNGDGRPKDAVLLDVQGPFGATNLGFGTYNNYFLDPVVVGNAGDGFFVGVYYPDQLPAEVPAPLDESPPVGRPTSFLAGAASGALDLEDLDSNQLYGSTHSFGFPGKWLVRCDTVANMDCNENGVRDACDIRDRTSRDRNRNSIPDECEDNAGIGGGNNNGFGSGIPLAIDAATPATEGNPADIEWTPGTEQLEPSDRTPESPHPDFTIISR